MAGARGGLYSANPGGFFEVESGAPLLRRNSKFITAEGLSDSLAERLDAWPGLCEGEEAVDLGDCTDEAALRIFLRDAERTFQDESHRTQMIELLKAVWPENRDYHQGLGYVSSLLMLFFDTPTTTRMLLRLTRDERYTPGYWRAAPEPYVRDAMVYSRLVEERHPEVAKLLSAACVVPEAYASKWFIGLCVHVLPFEALLPFVEAFLTEGFLYLFKFALALVAAIKTRLLACKPTEVNIIFELLRLDVTQCAAPRHLPKAAPPGGRVGLGTCLEGAPSLIRPRHLLPVLQVPRRHRGRSLLHAAGGRRQGGGARPGAGAAR